MKRYYVDTSAYLNVILAEDGHEALVKAFSGARLCSSSLMFLEAKRNVVRLTRQGVLTVDEATLAMARVTADVAEFTTRDLTLDLCTDNAFPTLSTPRSLDLAHLRTALWFHRDEALRAFVTLDDAQRSAAVELGLPVLRLAHT